jgi:hypothetical protein
MDRGILFQVDDPIAQACCATRKYNFVGDLRLPESQTARAYSLIRPIRTGRTGGQRGACARRRRRSGVAISGAISCRPSPTAGCPSRCHSNKRSGRGMPGRSGELDAAGRSCTSWDVIQTAHGLAYVGSGPTSGLFGRRMAQDLRPGLGPAEFERCAVTRRCGLAAGTPRRIEGQLFRVRLLLDNV